jgi:hypothetical protein
LTRRSGKPRARFLPVTEEATEGGWETLRAARLCGWGSASKVVKRSALVITVMSLVWYAGNIYFNILNKQVLKAFMFPFTCTCIYLGVCGLVGVAGWVTGLLEKPKLTQKQFVAFVPMAILHLLGARTSQPQIPHSSRCPASGLTPEARTGDIPQPTCSSW